MQYCRVCILPDSRPNLVLNNKGICNACESSSTKRSIDWIQRENQFLTLVSSIKRLQRDWDCIIPVSGGKDSTWQVVKALEYGLKPLCLTWKTPVRTSLGRKNLQNLIDLGVDHFDISINPEIEKIFSVKTLEKMGSPAIPMHMALFSLPIKFAYKFEIPLILWGENSAVEYGDGGDSSTTGSTLTTKWFKKFGVTNGTKYLDWVDEDLSERSLELYGAPCPELIEKKNIRSIFLGHYFKWSPKIAYETAKKFGFQSLDSKPITGIYKFADVDDAFIISIHHWIKWFKFGFTRSWDNLSLEIRSGNISRQEAILQLSTMGIEEPKDHVIQFCEWANISVDRFNSIMEKFRNTKIWHHQDGKWLIPDFLIRSWRWK